MMMILQFQQAGVKTDTSQIDCVPTARAVCLIDDTLRWPLVLPFVLVYTTVAGPETVTKDNHDRLFKVVEEQLTEKQAAWQPRLIAEFHFRAGKFQDAADLFEQNPKGPYWPTFQFLVAMAHHKPSNHDQAKKLFDETNDRSKTAGGEIKRPGRSHRPKPVPLDRLQEPATRNRSADQREIRGRCRAQTRRQ